MSSIAEMISKKVENMPAGSVFDYARLEIASDQFVTAAQSLSRLTRKGVISRLSKGKYYKPQQSKFGNSRPRESAFVDALTVRQNKRIGYLTGLSVYNQLGLTSQLSNTLVIATANPLQPKKLEGYNVKYVRRNVSFLDDDIPLLQLLDALRDIKSIPDSNPDDSLKILKARIADLSKAKKERLTTLALSFNPGTRALLGALIEKYFPEVRALKLKQSINRLSVFETGVSTELLPNKHSWNLI
ncbi:MAG TPA: DUF6088 family protein [Ohtaekwangia sp.]|nr:DUF6088 family protein [Ohtaekwangia sp.]